MFDILIGVFELAVIGVFIYFLYKWTQDEGTDTIADKKHIDLLTEQDYVDMMLR